MCVGGGGRSDLLELSFYVAAGKGGGHLFVQVCVFPWLEYTYIRVLLLISYSVCLSSGRQERREILTARICCFFRFLLSFFSVISHNGMDKVFCISPTSPSPFSG